MQLTVLPLLAERMEGKFDVFEVLLETLEKNNTKLQEGDVLVISTKYCKTIKLYKKLWN